MRLGSVALEGRLRYQTDWSSVPYLNRWDDNRQLKLNANRADNSNANWASPSVRDYEIILRPQSRPGQRVGCM
jgi:hypothetical protein